MSTITTTYPLSSVESQPRSAATPLTGPWGFWATLGWFVAAAAAFLATGILLLVVYRIWTQISGPWYGENIAAPIAEVICSAVAVLVLVHAARRAGWSARDYLGLVWPHRRYIFIGLGLLVAEWFFNWGLGYLAPSSDAASVINEYRATMGSPIALAMFWIGLVVVAPIGEEIAFRGFMMRGWMTTRLGVAGAIILSALIFAAMHTQYDMIGMFSIFVGGLSLGLMRWLSGSTVLAILMHAAWNLSVGIELALSV